jgi:hypothetical protein
MTTHFGSSWRNRLAHAAELDVAKAALRFIQTGLHMADGGPPAVSMALLTAAVESHLLQGALQAYATSAPVRGTPVDEMEQAQKEALLSLLEGFKMQVERYRMTTVAPYLGVLVDVTEAELAVQAGCLGARRGAPEGEPLEKAYAMCKLNVQRIEQRLGLLYTLGAMLQYGTHVDSAVPEQVQQVAAFLLQQRQNQLVRTLALGSLLGGAALDENRALAKKMFGPGMSLMSLTRMDAATPNYYTSSEEEALCRAIAHA